MMHGPEKSDLSTVAGKLANNPEGLRAEPVERREGTEGNTVKYGTRRTLSRGRCFLDLSVYGRGQGRRRRNGSPLYCITWMRICCGRPFPSSSGMRPREWTDGRGGSMSGTWKPILSICEHVFTTVPPLSACAGSFEYHEYRSAVISCQYSTGRSK
jgi:hypothetical protein